MNERYNLVFVGNQAIDKKICIDGKYVEVIGGSAYNSFCASKIFYNNLNSAYYAPVGNETKVAIMNRYNLNLKNDRNDVIFVINEISGYCDANLVICKNNLRWEWTYVNTLDTKS